MSNNTLFLIIGVMLMAGDVSWQKMVFLAFGLAFLFLLSLYWYQEKLLYQPKIFPQFATPSQNPPGYRSPGDHDMPFEDVYLTTPDGLRLHAWFVKQPNSAAAPTLLFFHANAGNMGFRLLNMKELYTRLACNILILSYRGYGESEGEPTEEGLIIDSECVWQYLTRTRRADIDPQQIFVFGRSLGGAVAISLVSRHNDCIRGLIVENTFTSISEMVNHLFSYLKYVKRWVLRLKWASVDTIKDLTLPILFLSGLQDEVVPPPMMAKLHASAVRSRFKTLKTFDGQHNDTWTRGGEEYMAEVKRFVARCLDDSELSNSIAAASEREAREIGAGVAAVDASTSATAATAAPAAAAAVDDAKSKPGKKAATRKKAD